MFAPTKVWRRWHRRVNKGQRRFAVVSALAASAVPSLVLARGHRIAQIPEVPLVLATAELSGVTKTKQALSLLKAVHADADIEKVKLSRGLRAGQGKSRNRRFVQRRGPLLVTAGEANLGPAFRNLAGVEIANVHRLNLLQLAPGGHVGRFIIWTQEAFAALDKVFGKPGSASEKSGFVLPRAAVTNADISRIVNSADVQSHLRAKKRNAPSVHRKNPLTNNKALIHLNPYAASLKRRAIKEQANNVARRDAALAARRDGKKPAAEKIAHTKKERKAAKDLRKTRSAILKTLFA
jgi:large subunit ribosomal protein L4e